jgi:ATP-dependent RNA helicase RhlE
LTSFQDLGLAAPIAQALKDEKYETPTPIQAEAIPHVLAGRDLVGIAQTGTGKTAAFALPILNHLAKNRFRPERRHCRVLVLSPTRELSGQILESFRTYGRHVRPTTALAIGGVPIGRQIRSLANGVDILVATPGRLLDLLNMNAVALGKLEILVLDEADRMLDMGFIRDIKKIIAKLPARKQTLFFSATMPQEIESLVAQLLNEPVRVSVTPVAKTADRINQRVVLIEKGGKNALLAETIKAENVARAIVFTRTKHGADRVVRSLDQSGIPAAAIHGNKSQNQRERVLADFRNGRIRILIATDIAARGIDVDGITHVFNFDLPNVAESYVHRIGRTARAGAEGIAISFCDHEEMAYLRDIEKLIQFKIESTDRRKDPHARPAAGKPQQHRRGGQHNRNHHGKSRDGGHRHGRGHGHNGHGGHGNGNNRNDRPNHAANGERPRHEARPESRPAGNGQADGNVGGVAFLNRKRDHRRDHGQGAGRHNDHGQRRPAS